ncbi:MAG: response regulator transcription factor [Pseudanabaenaceae cyanobacterium bins.68]|nr:response regulator transcription factor [Pseudanabaenaceae cyanobacterium bins.68]
MTTQIMIVEDERLVAQDIAELLKDEGYSICAITSTAKDAIAKISEFLPDLVLLDIRIKGELDGVNVAEHIQSFYAIPVIFLTAFSDPDTLARAQATQPMGYVTKPFRREQLVSSVKIALSNFRSVQPDPAPAASYRLKSTLAYIQTHLDQNINLEMLAGAVGMNPSYFCRVFQQEIGCSPYQYIIQQRIAKAKELLKNRQLSISEIALQTGFANHSHLDRHFHKLVGSTPKAYRHQWFKQDN